MSGEIGKVEEKLLEGEVEKKFLEDTKVLLGMGDLERKEYVTNVILWLADKIGWMRKGKGKIAQMKRLEEFGKMLAIKEQGEMMTICALFSMKPEFRGVWMRVMGELVGIEKQVEL